VLNCLLGIVVCADVPRVLPSCDAHRPQHSDLTLHSVCQWCCNANNILHTTSVGVGLDSGRIGEWNSQRAEHYLGAPWNVQRCPQPYFWSSSRTFGPVQRDQHIDKGTCSQPLSLRPPSPTLGHRPAHKVSHFHTHVWGSTFSCQRHSILAIQRLHYQCETTVMPVVLSAGPLPGRHSTSQLLRVH
jgi:hypothetical protein